MPFKSDKQRKACFATGGFGGHVDCEEWARKTKKKLKKMSFKEFICRGHPENPRRLK